MKIYTKTGDKGLTSLFGGTRVPKFHIRIEAYGTIDELNSYIGLLRDQNIDKELIKELIKIQNELFTIGSMLATPEDKSVLKSGENRLKISLIDQAIINHLENRMDKMNETLQPMTHFILPGGNTIVSYCHIARCICRRAERLCVELAENHTIDTNIIIYLNRLSDYLFVLARKLSSDLMIEEIPWVPSQNK